MGAIRLGLCLCILFLLENSCWALGYQTNLNLGADKPSSGRSGAFLLQGQFAILTKLIRLQSAFTGLYGASFLEGEGSLGVHIYLITPFISDNAWAHPFLTGNGSMGIGSLNGKTRNDSGYGYGAGIDLKFWKKSGITISIQNHAALENALRYQVGFFSQKIQ